MRYRRRSSYRRRVVVSRRPRRGRSRFRARALRIGYRM